MLKRQGNIELHNLQLEVKKYLSENSLPLDKRLRERWFHEGYNDFVFPKKFKVVIIVDDNSKDTERELVKYGITFSRKIYNGVAVINKSNLNSWLKNSSGSLEWLLILESGIYLKDPQKLVEYVIENIFIYEKEFSYKSLHLINLKKSNNDISKLINKIAQNNLELHSDSLCFDQNPIEASTFLKKQVSNLLDRVYYFNYEPLNGPEIADVTFEKFVALACGLKPIALINQYFKNNNPTEVILFDQNIQSLNYWHDLTTIQDQKRLFLLLKKHTGENEQALKKKLSDFCMEVYKSNDLDLLLSDLKKLKNAKLIKIDVLKDDARFLNIIDSSLNTFVWHSNIWSGPWTSCRMTRRKARIKQLELFKQLAENHKSKLWTISKPGAVHSYIGDSLVNAKFFFHDHGLNLGNFKLYSGNDPYPYFKTSLDELEIFTY